jgi:hypothetical protein
MRFSRIPRTAGRPPSRAAEDLRQWRAIGVAVVVMTVLACASTWLVLGSRWVGFVLGCCVAAIAVAAWYTLSGRTIGMSGEVRERVLERHYIGVAWYASMIRNTADRGGYERGLRLELTRLTAARLAERRGVNLYQDPAMARSLIGPDLWPLVDPAGAPRPGEPAPNVPTRAVAGLIDRLEQL